MTNTLQDCLLGILQRHEAKQKSRDAESTKKSMSPPGRDTLATKIFSGLKKLSPLELFKQHSTGRLSASCIGVSVEHSHDRASSGSTLIDSSGQLSMNATAPPKCSTLKIKPSAEQTLEHFDVQTDILNRSLLDGVEGTDPRQFDDEHTEFFTHLPFDSMGLGDAEQLKDRDDSRDGLDKINIDTTNVDALKALLKQNQEKHNSELAETRKYYHEELQSSHARSKSKHRFVVRELWRTLEINNQSRSEAGHRAAEFEQKNERLQGELQAKDFQLRQTTSLAEDVRYAYNTMSMLNAQYTHRIAELESLLLEKHRNLCDAHANIADLTRAINQDQALVNDMDRLLGDLHMCLNEVRRDSLEKSDALQGLAMLLEHNPSDTAGMKRLLEEKMQKSSDLQKEVKIAARELRSAKTQHMIDQEDADRKLKHLKNEIERKDVALQKAVSIKNKYRMANEAAAGKLKQRLTNADIVDTLSANHQLVVEDNSSLSSQVVEQERDLNLAKAQLAPFAAENCSLKSKNDLLLQENAAANGCIAELRRELRQGFEKHQRIVKTKDHEIGQRDLAIKDASQQAAQYLAENANGRERLDRIANDTYIAYKEIELNRALKFSRVLWAELSEFQKKENEKDEEDAAKQRADAIREAQHAKRVEDLELEVENLRELLDVKNGQADLKQMLKSIDVLRARVKMSNESNEDLTLLSKQFLTRIYALEARLPSSAVEIVGGERDTLMDFCQQVFKSNDIPFFTAEDLQKEEGIVEDEKVQGVFDDDDASVEDDVADEDNAFTITSQDNLGASAMFCQGYHDETPNESPVQQGDRAPGLHNVYDEMGNFLGVEYVANPQQPHSVKEGKQKEQDTDAFQGDI